jgi:cytoskeletal protein RodZ
VFEIGNSLREARMRRGLDYPELEQATKVRAKYLRALEEEEFEILPAPTYVRGFLRAYADYLGLDGQLYVDEYVSRYLPEAEEAPLRVRRSARPRPSRRPESNVLLVGLLAIGLITALVIGAWKFGGQGQKTGLQSLDTARVVRRSKPVGLAPPNSVAKIVLTAAHGSCWVSVHAGSSTGPILFEGTLEPGKKVRLSSRQFWIVAGTPANLGMALNGTKVPLAGRSAPFTFVANARGVVPAA